MATRLVLHVVDSPPIPLGEWEREQCVSMLGHEMDGLIQDHHENSERSDNKYAAQYLSDEGRILRVKTFTARSRPEITSDDAASLASQLDGTDKASTMLAQQTALALVKMMLASNQAQVQSFVQIVRERDERAREAEERGDRAREDLFELRRLVTEIREGEPPPEEMTPAQKQFFDLMNRALPLLMARMSGAS
jgi:hypothetical protein